ncbi:hypothetical protein PFTANZ_06417 [Plasmodium falciparum Tanzania (2000708)]|uniref:Surface antigen n=1 Tax=Plasmodium falciparum Tanzania (2000708) TaxID=1036725 RepID=A0A024VVX4_PLAFA|nr:hypothetical protein PFTANZ_06417 [Plasmodium falciparum Tanzania (2000708)]
MGGVAPGWGLVSGIVYTGWKAAALAAAKKLAAEAGAAMGKAAGDAEGLAIVIKEVESQFRLSTIGVKDLGLVLNGTNYTDVSNITTFIFTKYRGSCFPSASVPGVPLGPSRIPVNDWPFCSAMSEKLSTKRIYSYTGDSMQEFIKEYVKPIVSQAKTVAEATKTQVTSETTATLTDLKTGVW